MKKAIVIIFIAIACYAQAQGTRQDSAAKEQARQVRFIDSIQNKMPFKDFMQWVYKNTTAERYDQFNQLYQLFLQQQYAEYIKPKQR